MKPRCARYRGLEHALDAARDFATEQGRAALRENFWHVTVHEPRRVMMLADRAEALRAIGIET